MKLVLATIGALLAASNYAVCDQLTEKEMKLVYGGVLAKRGLTSAPIFGNVEISRSDSTVCGVVNIKNDFAQYMGNALFTGKMLGQADEATAFVLIDLGINPSMDKALRILCRQSGLEFDADLHCD